ncbi:MAG: HAD family hydrolase [Rickettsiales bacterium]|nr:HAD family hydrolase [Rickettsiales bacterium]
MELMKPKAILFDWDNTLVDTWPVIHEALAYCFRKMDKQPWTLEEVKVNVQQSMRDYFPKLFGDRWEEAGQYYLDGYAQVHKDRLVSIEGAEAVLKAIEVAGLYQAVVSNKKGPTLRIEAETIGWAHYFKAIIGADDAANDKPHPDHAIMALEHYPHPHGNDIWFVGDSAVDMEIAKNAGYTAIFYGLQTKADTVPHPIHAVVEDQAELLALVTSVIVN